MWQLVSSGMDDPSKKVGRGYPYSELNYGQLKKSEYVVESWAMRLRTNYQMKEPPATNSTPHSYTNFIYIDKWISNEP